MSVSCGLKGVQGLIKAGDVLVEVGDVSGCERVKLFC